MLELAVVPDELFVYRFKAIADVPLDALRGLGQSAVWSLTATPDEVSLVAPHIAVDEDVLRVGPWSGFRVAGTLDFGLTGVLASLTAPLAAAGISVFTISTHDTDYLLVTSATRSAAISAWQAAGIPVVHVHQR